MRIVDTLRRWFREAFSVFPPEQQATARAEPSERQARVLKALAEKEPKTDMSSATAERVAAFSAMWRRYLNYRRVFANAISAGQGAWNAEQREAAKFREFSAAWRRYVEIRRSLASGTGSYDALENAGVALAHIAGFNCASDFAGWKARLLAGTDSTPAAKKALILADIDFLIEDTTVAPEPDDDPNALDPVECRSRASATFGNYLDRW